MGIIMLGPVVGSTSRSFYEVVYKNVVQKRMESRRQATIECSPVMGYIHQRANSDIADATPNTSQIAHQSRHSCRRPSVFFQHSIGRSAEAVAKNDKDRFDTMRTTQRETARFHRWYRLGLSVIAFGIV